jgi:Mrp family chromosome partitioning ATPase
MALGWSYAAAGYRTILVDCDIVGRGMSRHLGLSDRQGVREVLRDRRLDTQIAKLSTPNLSALPVGIDPTIGPESIRRDDFATLCSELRQMYDVIIVDTGPYIGSVEMLPVASAADSVVFSIRRGRSRARLDECLNDLASNRIGCLGVILNCAVQSDCLRYVSKSTTSMRRGPLSDVVSSGKPEMAGHENALARAMGRIEREHVEPVEVLK